MASKLWIGNSSELLVFNENTRYEVKQNLQTVSTLVASKPAEGVIG